mgnify:FL=1
MTICKIQQRCSLCSYVNQDYAHSLETKFQQGLSVLAPFIKDAIALPPKPAPRPLHYRCSVKLAVRANPNQKGSRFLVGMYQPGTHHVGPSMTRCSVQHEKINALLADLIPLLVNSPLKPWDEIRLEGDLKYLAIRISQHNEEIMLTFVVSHLRDTASYLTLVHELVERNHQIKVSYLNIDTKTDNAIFGSSSVLLWGEGSLREQLLGLDFHLGPTSFFQINPYQAQIAYQTMLDLAGQSKSGSVAWDLYCGIGPIAMLLTQQGYRVIGIEENPQAVNDAVANATRNNLNVSFLSGRVETTLASLPAWATKPSWIIANPARTGIAPAAREVLKKQLAADSKCAMLYLSCNIETLARDLQDLEKSGRRLKQITAFDMFAQTNKLEWLASL